jgi:hypothetical protein
MANGVILAGVPNSERLLRRKCLNGPFGNNLLLVLGEHHEAKLEIGYFLLPA